MTQNINAWGTNKTTVRSSADRLSLHDKVIALRDQMIAERDLHNSEIQTRFNHILNRAIDKAFDSIKEIEKITDDKNKAINVPSLLTTTHLLGYATSSYFNVSAGIRNLPQLIIVLHGGDDYDLRYFFLPEKDINCHGEIYSVPHVEYNEYFNSFTVVVDLSRII